jgi:ATP-binding cassette subfamily F protein uup
MEMAVGKLSGGEQSRLLIARLMLQEANVLVLDEPTNDLDMATLGVLEDCLREFQGAVLLVTHDRYFLDQVCNRIYALPGDGSGEVVPFASLDQWEEWRTEREARAQAAARATATTTSAGPAAPAASPAKRRKLSYKEQRELDSMETVILEKEAKLATLTTESELPSNATNSIRLAELTTAMHALQSEIEALYSRWAELES